VRPEAKRALIFYNSLARPQLTAAGTYQRGEVYDVAGRQCRVASLSPAENPLNLSSFRVGL
jgi:hypothetical protein